jgi:hypothetical protein
VKAENRLREVAQVQPVREDGLNVSSQVKNRSEALARLAIAQVVGAAKVVALSENDFSFFYRNGSPDFKKGCARHGLFFCLKEARRSRQSIRVNFSHGVTIVGDSLLNAEF